MAVPGFQSYMSPILQLLADGQERRITEISDILAQHFQLTEADIRDLIPSGRKSRHYDRVGWAATYMKQAGLLASPRRGWYVVTARGAEVAQADVLVDTDFLRRYPEFVEFQSRTKADSSDLVPPVGMSMEAANSIHTPAETLDAGYQTLRNALAVELLERLLEASPQFFEQVVIDLLLAMGYGGSQREAARRVGQSGDGGIDGIINEDRLGLDVIYIQAKRWQSPVGASQVRDFTGSLEEKKAVKGIFITTSDFTHGARDFVERIGKRIVLIDGETLAQLMIDFDIGVTARKTYVIKRVDEDYFSEE